MKLKKSNIILICLAVVYFANIAVNYVIMQNIVSVKGNGNLETSEITVSAFEKINCVEKAEVRFYASEKYRVVVTIDENLREYIEILTTDSVLNIKTKNQQKTVLPTKFTVDVYCPVLTGVTMSGTGSFTAIDKIIASTFKSIITGSGKIEATIECDNYFAMITGSGNINVYGNSNDAYISIIGSGDLNGNDLNTKNANTNITGSGDINISVLDNLIAKITGSGNIRYSGEPKVDSNVSGSGVIRKM